MRLSIALVAAAAIGLGGIAAGSSSAAANTVLPLTPLVHEGAQDLELGLQEVRSRRGFRHGGWGGGSRRHFGGFHHRQHFGGFHHRRHFGGFHHPRRHFFRHHRRDHGAAAAAGLFGFALGAMAGQAFAGPRYPHYYYGGGGSNDAHVQWCLSRFRSYDIRTDTYLNFDGFRYRCNSPYRAW